MKKSVKTQIAEFLQKNHSSTFHGGNLQRMDFKTNKGGNATGDCIKRRCNDLVKEGIIQVSYKHGEAYFGAEAPKKKVQHVKTLPDGSAYVWYTEETQEERVVETKSTIVEPVPSNPN